ncbi:TIGR01244 family sulfur transferase [Tsuneonella sp. YG55]|uniref:TIGR01244 family sulfur transferase n=1 Tax=Tsuneonella litorea TaxID=2976475 RepID=A0A9X2W0B9_9SPHN|nr:TIGR01244 family sulfur transferase [Tsuneonella litorea]MCT2557666.1 TIGR01244 family sulfur transferase [Tsuneonella litorea]
MSDFRQLSDSMYASPQIGTADVAAAKEIGVALIVNNRPEGESDDQVPGPAIEAAARDAGIDYLAIPITHAGFSHPQVAALAAALEKADGPVLGYCRSGTRSTLLWALARASLGDDPAALADAAARAGYDVAPVRPAMDALAAQSR